MNRNQIENLYKINGINDYKLKNTEDLLKCHGVNFKQVDGYNRIDDINRAIYEIFIVNIFNAWGLEVRATLVPKGIYYVEHIEHLSKENPEDDYYIVVGATINAIDKNGIKSVLHHYIYDDYKNLKILENEVSNYLRFEYEYEAQEDGEPQKEWLHVLKEGSDWY